MDKKVTKNGPVILMREFNERIGEVIPVMKQRFIENFSNENG